MTDSTETRPPYGYAALTSLLVFGIYVATLAPTTAFWDTSEYLAAAYVLGIPHPPGNPLFTMLAHTFGALPLAASYAVRINLFAAVTSAASAGLWFLVAERWMRDVVPVRWARLAAAFAGTLVSATSWTVWNQSTVNEKVYTVSMFSTALVTWLGVHWADDEPGPHRDRWLVLIAYIIAISSTNHMMGVLGSIAVATYVLWTDWRLALKPWVLMMALTLALAVSGLGAVLVTGPMSGRGAIILAYGTLLLYTAWSDPAEFRRPIFYLGTIAVLVAIGPNYLFLPIRAAHFPPINEGEPIGFFSNALMEVLNRVQYGKPPVWQRQADFISQLGNYWQYFNWQFARDWAPANGIFTGLFAVLGLFGADDAVAEGQAGRGGLDGADGHADHCAHLLPQFQVRLLVRHRARPGGPRGPRARLLLRGLLRGLRPLGGGRPRRADDGDRRVAQGPGQRAEPVARRLAGPGPGAGAAGGQPR